MAGAFGMIRVLVVEDDHKVARFIQKGLLAEGFDVEVASNGLDGLRLATERDYDVISADVMMPGLDGVSLAENLRSKSIRTPLLLLTARDTLSDKLTGFEAGADDYLVKPFAFEELIARLRALARRKEVSTPVTEYKYADLHMDLRTREVSRSGRSIELTQKEFALLEHFMSHPETVFSRQKIGEAVWKEQFDRGSNVVDVYMMYLRKKIDGEHAEKLLHTVRGAGYILRKAKTDES
jgi:two-component system, OmpR family, copper resistance phosphate regulon response regulator CusR